MDILEEGVHGGHRSRMRSKFIAHGARIFDTYELLEMLLYHTIPRRDTNPIAKALLSRFGSLAGVLEADVSELAASAGIGEKTAELISLVGRADRVAELSWGARSRSTFDDFGAAGRFFTSYFKERESSTVIMLLDDTMRLLGLADIETPRFGSAATRPKPFIDAALRYGATVAIVAYTHRNGLAYPFESDIATCKMLAAELATVGVSLIECYIVEGDRFARSGPRRMLKSAPTPEMESFERSRSQIPTYDDYEAVGHLSELELSITDDESERKIDLLREYVARLLPYAIPSSDGSEADRLSAYFGSLDTLLSQSIESLCDIVGERGAVLLKLVAVLTSRAVCDGYTFGVRHTDEETIRYLHALMRGASVETVYLLSYDERGRVKACDHIGEGTVNASEVCQRRVAEVAVRRSASYVVLAHNHPLGAAQPSDDDVSATASLFATCRAVGVRLHRHIIVAGHDHCVLEMDCDDGLIRIVDRLV